MKKYAAVIVAFFPETEPLKEMLSLLKEQVEYIFVVDNTPGFVEKESKVEKIYFVQLGRNLGIATAQNIGLKKAIELGCERCLILDQDSIVPNDLCSTLGKDLDFLISKNNKVACIGPRIVDIFENKIETSNQEIVCGNNCFFTKQIIASGSLFHLPYIKEIGFMEDGLFIDAVDHEWCWRAASYGYVICISANVYMRHAIGLGRGKTILGNYIICSPIRHYYQFRNTFLLLFRDYVPIKWKIKKISEIILMPFVYLIKGPDRKKRAKYMYTGIVDGIIRYTGKIR